MNYPVRNFKERFNTTRGNAYGVKITPTYYHSGNDINSNTGGNTDCGTPLLAVADGEVSSVHSHATGYGNHIHIKHTINGRIYWSHYAHLETMAVSVGQVVREGDVIGTLGNTGNSDYCHLHFEIKNTPTGIDGIAKSKADLSKWENPLKFIEANLGNVIISPPETMNYKEIFDKTGNIRGLEDRSPKPDFYAPEDEFKKAYVDPTNGNSYVVVNLKVLNDTLSYLRELATPPLTYTTSTNPLNGLHDGDNFTVVIDPPVEVKPDLPANPATEFDIFDWLWGKITDISRTIWNKIKR